MLNFLHRMSLSVKVGLLTVVGFILFGAALMSFLSSSLHGSLLAQAQNRMNINIAVMRDALSVHGKEFKIQNDKLMIGDHVLNGDFDSVDHITGLVGGVATVFMGDTRVATNIKKPDGTRAVGTKLDKNKAYETVLDNGKTFSGEASILGKPHLTVYDPIKDKDGKTIGILFVGLDKQEQLGIIDTLINNILWVSVVIGLFVSAVVYSIIRGQLRPLTVLQSVMARLGKDDTSVDVPARERGDEIGGIAQAIDIFKDGIVEKLALRQRQEDQKRIDEQERRKMMLKMADDFESKVKSVVVTVSSAATEMQSSAASMAAVAEETNRQATAVSAAAEETSASIQTVASASEELDSSISEISRQIGDSARVAAQCVKEAEATSVTMNTLNKTADEVGGIVKLIEGIASQVNLLALNATIEAARAGEAGRGFAVVANEVKNLAGQVATAAQNITSQIGDIQGQTSQAVQTIENITTTIKRVNDISTTIANAIEQQSSATKEIAHSIQETSTGTSEVVRNIVGVTRAAAETGTTSAQVLDTAKQLSEEGEKLRRVVEDFIASIRKG